jgi:hypothetical protein
MDTLVDALTIAMALLCVVFIGYGAWLCLPPLQRKRPAEASAPTSVRKRVRSISERLSASSR